VRRLPVRNVSTIAITPVLRKGQRWNMLDQQLRIYRVGIHLVEFRVFKSQVGVTQQKLGRSSLEPIATVQGYLQKHQAVLGSE